MSVHCICYSYELMYILVDLCSVLLLCEWLLIGQAPAYFIRIHYNITQHDESEWKTSVSYPTSFLPLSECTALFQEDRRSRGQHIVSSDTFCLFFLVQFVVAQLVKKFSAWIKTECSGPRSQKLPLCANGVCFIWRCLPASLLTIVLCAYSIPVMHPTRRNANEH